MDAIGTRILNYSSFLGHFTTFTGLALKPWTKLFQNMRASRQTELEETFPSHVVCRWMGNSVKVAQKHYLQTTEDHYKKATQNPTQQASASPRIASLSTSDDPSESQKNAESQRLKGNKINPTRARTLAAKRWANVTF